MTTNPFDLTGGAFLGFYAGVIACGVAAVFCVRGLVAASADAPDHADPRLDAYETAALAGGSARVALLAVASLVERGHARIDGDAITYARPADLARLHPVERAVLQLEPADIARVRARVAPATEAIEASLAAQHFRATPESASLCRGATWAAMLLTLAIGATKAVVGASRGRPIGFLVVLMVMAAVTFAMLLRLRPPSTARGRRVLDALRRDRPHGPAAAVVPGHDLAMLVAIWGLPALADHSSYARLHRSLAKSDGGGTVGGSGCSSSSSSSSSGGGDGGGSCGGGCGGCGGS